MILFSSISVFFPYIPLPLPSPWAKQHFITPVPPNQHCFSCLLSNQSRSPGPHQPFADIIFIMSHSSSNPSVPFYSNVWSCTISSPTLTMLYYMPPISTGTLFLFSSRRAVLTPSRQVHHSTGLMGKYCQGIVSVTILVSSILPEMGKQGTEVKYFLSEMC